MEELLQIALVGTSRAAALPPAEHPAERLAASDSPERLLLLRAGARSLYARAGRKPVAGIAPPEPAGEETRPAAGPRFELALRTAFAEKQHELLIEFLREFEAFGLNLPHALLPTALNAADAELRAAILPVLGERGLWLARFRPEWNWVSLGTGTLSEEERRTLIATRWEEGNIADRTAVLVRLRGHDPAEARTLLEEIFKSEKADHRVRLLETFVHGLSPADEPFLEAALDDRSENVRSTAADLLVRLPDSGLAARMRTRAEGMFAPERRGARLFLHCTPPTELPKDWARDGIHAKIPKQTAKRATWPSAVHQAVPLAHWNAFFSATAEELVEAAREETFAIDIVRGWSNAAINFAPLELNTAEWLGALWDYWERHAAPDHISTQAAGQKFLHLFPPEELERRVIAGLRDAFYRGKTLDFQLLSAAPRPWGELLSREYLDVIRRVLARGEDVNASYQWLQTLHTAAGRLHPALLAEALEGWPEEHLQGRHWAWKAVEDFRRNVSVRLNFYRELEP